MITRRRAILRKGSFPIPIERSLEIRVYPRSPNPPPIKPPHKSAEKHKRLNNRELEELIKIAASTVGVPFAESLLAAHREWCAANGFKPHV